MIESSSYDTWLVVSSSDESGDSDKIDSDIEAELYSVIHHETDTSTIRESPVKQSSQNKVSVPAEMNKNPYTVDMFNNNNLYTSFESPPKRTMSIKSTPKKITQQPNYTTKSQKRKSDCAFNEDPLVLDISIDHLDNSLDNARNEISSQKNALVKKPQSSTSNGNDQEGKAEFIARVLQNIQVKSTSELGVNVSSRKKQKIVDASLKIKSEEDVTVEAQNSDSDSSVIWSEVEETDVKLQTNLELDIVTLSSDSDSDDSFSPLEESGLSSFLMYENTPQPSTSFSTGQINDPWHVDAEDLYRSKKGVNRYHERAALQCSNCNLKGHVAKFCSVPKAVRCFICGGKHLGYRCKEKLCYKCFRYGHNSKICNFRLISACSNCNMKGHTPSYCPDLWRRYHLTTKGRKIVVGRALPQDTSLFCYNCGSNEHWGAVCMWKRYDSYSFPTWPAVIDYSQPLYGSNDVRLSFPATNNFTPPPPPAKQFPKMKKKNNRKKKIKLEKNASKSPANRNFFPPPLGQKFKVEKFSPKSPANVASYRSDIRKSGEGFPRTPKASGSRPFNELTHRQIVRLRKKQQRKDLKQQEQLFGLRRRLGLPPHPMTI